MSFWIYALIIAFLLFWRFSLSSKNRYPPGPPSVPGVGHVFQVPTTQTWRYFENLSLRYGPLFRLSLAGNDVLVLNKSIDAEELLGRRSHNYSSRPPLVYAGKYQSNNKRLVLLPYGPTLKRQRTAFHQMLQPRVVGAYESMQEFESLRLLHDIVNKPTEAFRHSQRFAAALVFTLSYGKRLGDNDSDLDSVIAVIQGFVRDTYPGAHLVDTFPALDLLPDFLAPWRAKARAKHEFEMKLYNRLVLEVKDRMESGKQDLECFAARLWERQNIEALDLEEISYVAGTAFEAGTDSTAGTIQWFFMAMILYPDAMRQAQVELDGLLGADGQTVPGFAHINELPYCFALTKEVLRWAPAAPGGFPHYSDADDEYKGFKINAKTMVIPCIWSMHHDPDEFPDPYVFRPERFLPSGGAVENDLLTEGHYGFGFGRRKCPGQYLGSKTIWIGLTRLLWAFDIQPGLDKDGKPVIISPDNCTSGMTS
ncbi:cytochrome P450 [Desarmillaria tabescens]|uniref:Cytochrome P450 n=1 Tax=Armillaria tabescens TaxID=1929756 RepID=A0AA39KD47_ARMTA|nr:cytochrome P450 [Desarmillaria tabescens]KAK0458977.1 cytochrome P450 [Desarmillaria tabescens]